MSRRRQQDVSDAPEATLTHRQPDANALEREERAAELVVLAARQPTTKLPSGSLVRRGTRKSRLDVDANDMNQEAARRSWDAAEALCAVADAGAPES